MNSTMYIPLGEYIDSLWPKNILEPPNTELINNVWIEPLRIENEPSLNVKTSLLLEEELGLSIPGVEGVSIVLAAAGSDSAFLFEFFTEPSPGVRVVDIPIAIRFARDLLQPATLVMDAEGNQVVQVDPTREQVDITLAKITLTANFEGGFGIEAEGGIDLPLCLIGETGVGIEARGLRFVGAGDTPPPGKPAGWSGIHIPSAGLYLPGELGSLVGQLTLTDATIGNGGFSGTVTDTWAPELEAALGGLDLKLRSVALTFVQNSFTQCEIHGTMRLPFFDAPLDVEIGINLDGSFAVRLSDPSGLVILTKPDILELQVLSMGIARVEGVFMVRLSGKIRPLVGGLDWPGFDVRELSIDAHGNVKIEGGWIDLRNGYALDFHGFKVEITKIGFGKAEDGGKWIGFSGSLNLVDGFSAGASVEGLKVTWYEDGSHDPKITLEGVGVELEIPNAVSFKGRVAYREFVDALGNTVHQFDGDIKLKLLAVDLEVDAVLVIGSALKPGGGSYTFFAIYITVELPAGIPLWSTGIALYGLAGIFALQMEPDKRPDEEWYGVGPSDGWYKRPAIGVTDLAKKWRNEEDSLALGGGLTLGTVADNGFTFSGRMLLVMVFPGPILMIEGKANLLKERSSLSEEPIFRALAVLDGRAGTLLFGLDAQYRVGSGGELLDIRGGAEAFFDFHDQDRWHLYLGLQEPREKRIRARVFNLFESNSYFMLDARGLRLGAWTGYDKKWKYGPVKITLEAWLEANAAVNWKPIHFHGDVWAHGKVSMRVFGFGFGLSLDARLAGDVFDPFHILAELEVELDLPWPIPNVDVDFSLEWGPELTPPPIPMVLKEVAVEHFKVTSSWPLPRNSLLLPNFDHDGFIGPPSGPSVPANLNALPVVPLDCRPHITFGRPVHDAALIGANPQPPNPAVERVGDPANNEGPASIKYILKGITLEKFTGGVWVLVARKADTPNPPGIPELFGSWAPVPGSQGGSATQSVGQVKLWVWSKNPFDYTRGTSGAWDEWFSDHYPTYPCIPDAPGKHICCDFTRYRPGDLLDAPHVCDPEMVLLGFPARLVQIERQKPPIEGFDRVACVLPEGRLLIHFARPARHVDIHLRGGQGRNLTCVDFAAHLEDKDKNPLAWQGLNFTVFEPTGGISESTLFKDLDGVHSLVAGSQTHIDLPQPAGEIEITMVLQAGESRIVALNSLGQVVDTGDVPPGTNGPQKVVLRGPAIMRIGVAAAHNEAFIQKVCFGAGSETDEEVRAIVNFVDGTQSPPFFPENHHIVIDAEDILTVAVLGRSKFCVVQVCADLGPDPQEVLDRQEMVTHLQNATARWSQVGEVLEPNTIYRMKILTRAEAVGEGELAGWTDDREQEESAYFRTEGPPGLTRLTVPANEPNPDQFDSGLDDLSRYVKQTVPATVPPPGQKALLPKPVYRAYDVGVEFNEDYVDLMYRIAGRDLGLYLFDNNNLPVRDAAGRLIVRQNEWGRVESLTLDASEERWVQIVNASTCAVIGEETIPKDVKISSGAVGQVLKADTLHEARLVPLLVHESFAKLAVGSTAFGPAGALGRWRIVDQGTSQGPSQWQIAETAPPVTRYVVQNTNIWGGTTDGLDPLKPGSMLIYGNDPNLPPDHADQPGRWTDYRLTAFLRSEDNDAVGLVFRYVDSDNYYRFSMDAERRYRRLVRVAAGAHTILAEDDRRYRSNVDYAVTVEAIGPALRVYLDGELILESEDTAHSAGGIGLYCWASEKARFFDIRVDDFRNADPISNQPAPVYRFPFTTSKFAHFTHHVQSFRDRTWLGELEAGAPASEWLAAASPPGTPVTEAEWRAYEQLAEAVLGSASAGFPNGLEVTRVEQNGSTLGFLVETSEPFDWSRTGLDLLKAPIAAKLPALEPGVLKIVSAAFAASHPKEESVSLVARDSLELRGHTLEAFQIPGPIQGSAFKEYFFEDFNEAGHGLLFEETFGQNALDHYAILDQDPAGPPSAWGVNGGLIRQTAESGGEDPGNEIAKPGALALTGDPEWKSVRIRARLRSTGNNALGLVFRYQNEHNYYRFSTDHELQYRRLVKCENGVFTTLWEDTAASYTPDTAFDLQIYAFEKRLVGLMDRVLLFDVSDEAHKLGQTGLYTWKNPGAEFHSLRVDSLDFDPVLAKPDLSHLAGWLTLDPEGALEGPSEWSADGTGIQQAKRIRVEGAEHFGTHLVTGGPWDDLQLSVDLRSSEDGAMGVLIRYQNRNNYYRFSMNRAENYRRLEKCINGTVVPLWEAADGFELDQTYRLSLQARGNLLEGWLDGQPLFSTTDGDLGRGSVGLYTWNNGGARFSQIHVLSLASFVGAFRIFDGRGLAGESAWQTRFGVLQQRATIGDSAPPQLGTHALAPVNISDTMRLVVEGRSDTGQLLGVLFRYQDEDNYYRFSVQTPNPKRELIKVVDGVATTLWQAPGGYSPETLQRFTVDTFGDRLVGYFDGEKLFEVQDSSFSSGRVGVYTSQNDSAAFESLQVTTPPVEASALFLDRFSEEDLTGWTFLSEATVGGSAQWSVAKGALSQTSDAFSPPEEPDSLPKQGLYGLAGDPAWGDIVLRARLQSDDSHAIGLMFRYQDQDHYYRFSMDQEQAYRRLVKNVGGDFTLLWEDGFAFETGRSYEVVIVAAGDQLWGYFDGVPMFAVDDPDLSGGQIGLYCWKNPGAKFSGITVLPGEAAFSDWAFKDNFPYLVVDRWAFTDVGEVDAPSNWSVTDKQLVQTSSISGDEPRKGTFAVSDTGSRNWGDYRFTTSMLSTTDGVIGMAARYRDANNHYRFESRPETQGRRLVRVVEGVEAELWSDSGGYVKGEPVLASLDFVGERISLYINGARICEVIDDAIASGRIALFTFNNPGAAFDFVRVQEPAWQTYYRFGKQPAIPAGQRLRVLACSQADAPEPLPNVQDVFSAGPGERGSMRFFGTACDLRLRDPQGRVQHARTFLRPDLYNPLPEVRLLRRLDGCGFFIALPSETPEFSGFEEVEYRLKLTYRLDNKAKDPDSQVLREAGLYDPEVTQIDLPW